MTRSFNITYNGHKYKIITDDATFVVAETTYAKKKVSGKANLDPRDTFNIDTGMFLAMDRANLKVAKKRVANAREQVKYFDALLADTKKWRVDAYAYLNSSLNALQIAESMLD